MTETAADTMQVVHKDVVIKWSSKHEEWTWTDPVTKRQRSSESLRNAKKTIDESTKPECGFKALYVTGYTNEAEFYEVKVVGQSPGHRKASWRRTYDCLFKDGSVKSIGPSNLYEDSKANRNVLAALQKLIKQHNAIERQMEKTRDKLVNVELPS